MRGIHKFLLTVCVTTAAVGLAVGQGRQGGGRFGMGNTQGAGNPLLLINNDGVRKEIKLTDEQLAKVPAAAWKALSEVLTPEQQKRLRQIVLQQRGSTAFSDPKVQAALKLTDDQKDAIKTALEDQSKEMKEMFGKGKGGFGKGGGFEKIQELRKGTLEKITGVLTPVQKREWNEMIGEEFKMQFGGGRKGGGRNKKKLDTE